jgi:hypothetical protein
MSELDHKRLTEEAMKRGGTISDAVREIVSQFFDKQSHTQHEQAQHEKTRANIRDVDIALAEQSKQIEDVKNGFQNLTTYLAKFIPASMGAQK